MEKIIGNFLTQPNKDFPLDCETLEYLQSASALAALAANIAGDRVVLAGCELNGDATHRAAGYVFLRTRSFPDGEILPWEGGSISSGMYVKQDPIKVTANNVDYSKAYTRRSLSPGFGEEHYDWESFTDIATIKELMNENAALRAAVKSLQPAPLGSVTMWAGSKVPEGYVLCNGQALRASDYPELSAVLGTTFNTASSAGGGKYTTDTGFFRVPDLRGRFVVGEHDSDSDYGSKGASGGKKTVTLGVDELPSHSHEVKDYMMIPNGTGECQSGTWTVGGASCRVGYESVSGHPKHGDTSGSGNDGIQWIQHSCESAGSGAGHENRPPYYVLAYIMRVK